MSKREYKLALRSKKNGELIEMFNKLRRHKCFMLLSLEFDIYEELIGRGYKRITK